MILTNQSHRFTMHLHKVTALLYDSTHSTVVDIVYTDTGGRRAN